MKYIIALVLFIGIFAALQIERFKQEEQFQISAIEKFQKETAKISLEGKARSEQIKKEIYENEKVKVFIKARDTKTCMKVLNAKELNNQVAECNKDRYVEVRRSEINEFMKENGLWLVTH